MTSVTITARHTRADDFKARLITSSCEFRLLVSSDPVRRCVFPTQVRYRRARVVIAPQTRAASSASIEMHPTFCRTSNGRRIPSAGIECDTCHDSLSAADMNLRSLARLILSWLGLLGMVRRLRARHVIKPSDVMARESVESLVAGADEYYRSAIAIGGTAFLKSKPFHSFDDSPQVLVRLGWLLHGARLTAGLQVAEYGGGAGWLAALLWQMGCHVTCVDASAAALELARELFEERRPLLTWPTATCATALTD